MRWEKQNDETTYLLGVFVPKPNNTIHKGKDQIRPKKPPKKLIPAFLQNLQITFSLILEKEHIYSKYNVCCYISACRLNGNFTQLH